VKQKNKEETIAKFKELRPDAVVIDLRMPEKGEVAEVALGGVSAIEIRRLDPNVKIIVCSACIQEKYKELLADFVDIYITKPYKKKTN